VGVEKVSYLNISNVGQKIAEVKKTYKEECSKFGIDPDHKVFVANSGGKDSGATDLLAMAITEGDYQSVACDTGNENPLTINHLKTLHTQPGRGGSEVKIIKAEYSQASFDKRLERMKKGWSKKQVVMAGSYRGISMPSLSAKDTKFAELWRARSRHLGFGEFDCALDALTSVFKKSGNPFLDMCLLHGGFPLGRNRYCTKELKVDLAYKEVYEPALEDVEVVVWSGVRADESEKRSTYDRFSVDSMSDTGDLYNFLPIHNWTAPDVFAIYKYFGVKPNPLYSMGMGRVGCMPCILVNKEELAETAARFPEEIARIHEWEKIMALVSRWVHWMIVGHVNRRQFKGMKNVIDTVYQEGYLESGYEDDQGFWHEPEWVKPAIIEIAPSKKFKFGHSVKLNRIQTLDVEAYRGTSMLGPRGGVIGGNVYDAIEWSKTGRGGKVYDLVQEYMTQEVCSSKYGLCE
jgi:3'-phosphoadenosine 5'-phosphosulfate sulfotransferase (PAPS reductase)/FAD synthetase